MSIANYGDLKSAVASWLNRTDLASYIPDFITSASGRIYYGSEDDVLPSPPVRTWSMQTVETPTVTNGSFALPTRYLQTILIMGDDGGSGTSIDFIAPGHWSQYNQSNGVGQYYTILNNAVQLSGTGTQTITHHYYQSFAAFSGDSDTNALLDAQPFLWVYGALIEAYVFVENDTNAKKFHRLFNGVAGALNKTARMQGGGSLTVRAR